MQKGDEVVSDMLGVVMHFVRWLFLIPAVVAAWAVVFAVGLLAFHGLTLLCPEELLGSGACAAPWFHPAENFLIASFAAFSAAVVLLVARAVAPSHRRAVVRLAFAIGFSVALLMGYSLEMWWPFAGAVLAGMATLVITELWAPLSDEAAPK